MMVTWITFGNSVGKYVLVWNDAKLVQIVQN